MCGNILQDPGALTECGLDLLKGLLILDPTKRLTAAEAAGHPYFKESPLPQSIGFMPTAPETNLSGQQTAFIGLTNRVIAVHRRRDSSEDDDEDRGAAKTRTRVNVSRYLRHLKD